MAEIIKFPDQLLNADEQMLSSEREHEYIRRMTEPSDSQWSVTIQEWGETLPENRREVRA